MGPSNLFGDCGQGLVDHVLVFKTFIQGLHFDFEALVALSDDGSGDREPSVAERALSFLGGLGV